MTVQRLEDQLGEVVEHVIEQLSDPDDEVTYGVCLSTIMVNTEEEPAGIPGVSLYLALRCPEYAGDIAGMAELPFPMVSTPGAFSVALERLWDEISFRRIALALPDLEARSRRIVAEE